LKTCQRSLVDELDTSEDPLLFSTDVQHDHLIETQHSVLTQVLKGGKKKVHIRAFDSYMLTNSLISYILIVRCICSRRLGIHNRHVFSKEILYTCRKW
jgi:hypothetical protein